jgi:hypothetical protein
LEELAAQNEATPELPDQDAFEQEMQAREAAPTPATGRAGPRTRGTATASTNGTTNSTPDGEATGTQTGLMVTAEATQHTFADSTGQETVLDLPEGVRINVAHDHNGDARRPSCAICMGIWEHERQVRQRASANARSTSRQTLEQATTYDMVDSANTTYQIDLPAGSTIITRDNHEHGPHRVPTCALCMAILERERSIRPQSTRSTPTPKSCECGCGGQTRGGRFLPGHDARLYGRIKRYNDWFEENAEKITSGEVSKDAFRDYADLPQSLKDGGTCPSGHGPLVLFGHERVAATS